MLTSFEERERYPSNRGTLEAKITSNLIRGHEAYGMVNAVAIMLPKDKSAQMLLSNSKQVIEQGFAKVSQTLATVPFGALLVPNHLKL